MNLSPSALSEVEAAFKKYGDAVLASDLSATSQGIYLDHARNFIRWLKGEFNPGARKNPFPIKRKTDLVPHAFNPGAVEKAEK